MEKRNVRTLRLGEEKKHFEILNLCYAPWGDEGEWRRRYLEFPGFDITKNVLIVEENGEWSGGVTTWFREAILSNGNKIKVSLAGDAYVLPSFEGKGVYSTGMRGINEMARKERATLGFAFPTVYGLAAAALSKYGFTEVFHPVTKIFLLKPERFLNDLLSRTRHVVLPKKFDGVTVKLVVSLDKKSNNWATRMFRIEKGKLKELRLNAEDAEEADLTIKSDIDFLIKVTTLFYRRNRALYISVLWALVQRRLGLRLSLKFFRAFLGL